MINRRELIIGASVTVAAAAASPALTLQEAGGVEPLFATFPLSGIYLDRMAMMWGVLRTIGQRDEDLRQRIVDLINGTVSDGLAQIRSGRVFPETPEAIS